MTESPNTSVSTPEIHANPIDDFLAEQAEAIRALARRTAEGVIEIGNRLVSVKVQVGHGRFLAWIDAEFDMSLSTATRMMQVAEAFKFVTVTNLGAKVLYALAAPSTPPEVREQFVAQAEAGESVRYRDVKAAIDEAKALPPLADDDSDLDDETEAVATEPADWLAPHPHFSPVSAPRPTSVVEQLLAVGQSIVDELPPEDVVAGEVALIEAQELPVTSRLFAEAVSSVHAARLKLRKVRPDLLRELVDGDEAERKEVEDAIVVLREMTAFCRVALGVGPDAIRRVV